LSIWIAEDSLGLVETLRDLRKIQQAGKSLLAFDFNKQEISYRYKY